MLFLCRVTFTTTWEQESLRMPGKDIILHYLPTGKLAQENPTPWWGMVPIKVKNHGGNFHL